MKTKKLKRFVCLLLAFVVLLAMPMNTQAHAAVAVPWVMYAIITGLAAMGITFTVAGGVDAMINAMEEKVDDYQKQGEIIDFYEVMRRNIKMVPSPSGGTDPDGNQLRNLFFNALAWDALEKFVDWLTSDGGWGLGTKVTTNKDYLYYYGWINDTYQAIILPNFEISEYGTNSAYYKLNLLNDATLIPVDSLNASLSSIGSYRFMEGTDDSIIWTVNFNGGNIAFYKFVEGKYNNYYYNNLINAAKHFGYDSATATHIIPYFTKNPTTNEYTQCRCALVMPDGSIISANSFSNSIKPFISEINSTSDIEVPTEIPRLTPEQTQGVIMQQLEIGSPEIKEWARQVEELFIETGTIPQPQPEVITDPATQPVPTPAPTAPPIQDVDDLGLPTLGEAVFNKFPFSLPRDLKRIAEILNAEPVTPYWEVDLFAPLADDISFAGDTTLRIDLTEYEALGQISRWASVIGFCIMLIIITKGVIKW